MNSPEQDSPEKIRPDERQAIDANTSRSRFATFGRCVQPHTHMSKFLPDGRIGIELAILTRRALMVSVHKRLPPL
jgi:hypothetical protein